MDAQHDKPGVPLIAQAPVTLFPQSLEDLIELCCRPRALKGKRLVCCQSLSDKRGIVQIGATLDLRELGLPEARVRVADPKLWFAGR